MLLRRKAAGIVGALGLLGLTTTASAAQEHVVVCYTWAIAPQLVTFDDGSSLVNARGTLSCSDKPNSGTIAAWLEFNPIESDPNSPYWQLIDHTVNGYTPTSGGTIHAYLLSDCNGYLDSGYYRTHVKTQVAHPPSTDNANKYSTVVDIDCPDPPPGSSSGGGGGGLCEPYAAGPVTVSPPDTPVPETRWTIPLC